MQGPTGRGRGSWSRLLLSLTIKAGLGTVRIVMPLAVSTGWSATTSFPTWRLCSTTSPDTEF